MKDLEQQLAHRLESLRKDSEACAVFMYTELSLHFHIGSDFDLQARVNPHAAFWNGIFGALQAAAFIALGRMYDRDGKKNHTIGALIDFASTNVGLFSRQMLEARKIQHGLEPAAAKEYAAAAFELKKGGLAAIKAEFATHQKLYVDKVEPIRHTVFAHAGRMDKADRDGLFSKVFIRELERLTVFPLRLYRALRALYFDGYEPVLDTPITIVRDVMNSLPDKWTTTWEHFHVAKNASDFLEWLNQAPVPPDPRRDELVKKLKKYLEPEGVTVTTRPKSRSQRSQKSRSHPAGKR